MKTSQPLSLSNRSLQSPGVFFEMSKRLIDICGSVVGILVLLPVLCFCALWIRLVDGGPVFYSQWRVGSDGWLFKIYKFRTMGMNAEKPGSAQWASKRDPRVLFGCNIMRRSHVDELPQLWNILKGDMSLVGPRPERPEMFEQLRKDIPGIERRLAGRPGLTGLAQIKHGYTNDLAGARRKVAFDLRYLRHRSVLSDVKLLLATFPKVWDQAAL
jgi:lipopolysaccharide/colanic/teichoic acid biosynthesis glycosyltransferase